MSFADTIYNLRSSNRTMVQVADAIDGLASGRMSDKTVTATGSETVDSEGLIFVNNSSNITLTLPAPSTCQGKTFAFIKITDNANTATIATPSGAIFGALKNELAARSDYLIFASNGANYFQIGGSVSGVVSWTPTYSASGSMTVTLDTLQHARYQFDAAKYVNIDFSAITTVGGTVSNIIYIGNFPFNWSGNQAIYANAFTPSTQQGLMGLAQTGESRIRLERNGENWIAGTTIIRINGRLRIN